MKISKLKAIKRKQIMITQYKTKSTKGKQHNQLFIVILNSVTPSDYKKQIIKISAYEAYENSGCEANLNKRYIQL